MSKNIIKQVWYFCEDKTTLICTIIILSFYRFIMSSIFTKIIKGEIPCNKIYEDNICFAFLDINPVTKGHTLLIPKQEFQQMTDTPDDILTHCFIVAKKLMQKMKKYLRVDYVQVCVEGLQVPHFHIHLIPSMLGNENAQRTHVHYREDEAEKIASLLQSSMKTL